MNRDQDYIVVFAMNKEGQWAGEKWYTGSFLDPSQWGRMTGETFISSYKEKMEALRKTDNAVREWATDLDNIVKKMHKANKANKVLEVAILLGKLNNKLTKIEGESNKLEKLNETGLKSLEEEIDRYEMEHEEYLDKDILKGLENVRAQFQWFKDWRRKWDTNALEKKYRKERRMAINKLVDGANKTVHNVKKMLKNLTKYRKAGEIDSYIRALSGISEEQNNFKNNFVPVYNTYLKPVVDRALARQEARQKSVQESLEAERKRLENITAPTPASEKERENEADEEFRKELGNIDKEVTPTEVKDIEKDIFNESPDISVEEEGGQQVMPWGIGPRGTEPEKEQPEEYGVPEEQLGFNFSKKEKPKASKQEIQKMIDKMVAKRKERGNGKRSKQKQWNEWEESREGWEVPEGTKTMLEPFEQDILDPKQKTSRPGFEGRIPEAWRDIPKWPEAGAQGQRPVYYGQKGLPKAKTPMENAPLPEEFKTVEPGDESIFFNDETEPMETEASLESLLLQKQHKEFISELNKIASRHNDPYLIANMLVKYAGIIEDKDLETSLKLLAIAEGFDGDR